MPGSYLIQGCERRLATHLGIDEKAIGKCCAHVCFGFAAGHNNSFAGCVDRRCITAGPH